MTNFIKQIAKKYQVNLSDNSAEAFDVISERREYPKDRIILQQGQQSHHTKSHIPLSSVTLSPIKND